MIINARKWLERLKYVLLFLILTFVVSRLFFALEQRLDPFQRNDVPNGDALKVFMDERNRSTSEQMLDQLLWFYWYGE